MNTENTIFGFFIILALTLNFGFFIGDFDNPAHHNVYELFAAIVVNLMAMLMKLGARKKTGTILLATSLVANLQLIAAALVWTSAIYITEVGMTPEVMGSIVSLAGGAMLANVVSTILLITENFVVDS